MKTLKEIVEADNLPQYMADLGRCVEDVLPSLDGDPENRCLFVLLIADNEAPDAHYVSNGRREDCVKWLRETADRLERKEDRPLDQKPKMTINLDELEGE